MDANTKSAHDIRDFMAALPGFRLFVTEKGEPKIIYLVDANANIVARLKVVDGVLRIAVHDRAKIEIFA